MNKQIISMTAVAAMAGAALAVESKNVVGFQNFGRTAFEATGATFVKVGSDGSTMTLGDIKVNSVWDYGSDFVTVLENNGMTSFQVSYLGASDAAAESVAEGWYLASDFDDWEFTHCKNDYSLPFGTALILQRGTDGAALVYSGEVVQSSVELDGNGAAFQLVANVSPKALTLGQIKVNSVWDYGSDFVTILENDGMTSFQVSYLGASDAAAESVAEGWYLASDFDDWEFTHCKNDYSIPAGYGFIFQKGTDGAALVIPSPLD